MYTSRTKESLLQFFNVYAFYLFLGDEFEVSEGAECKIVSEIVAQSSS